MLLKRLEHFHSRILQGLSDCSPFVKLTLMEKYRFHMVVQVFKVLHLLCPQYLRDWFVFAETITGRQGRNKHRLYVPQIFSSIGKNSFYYRGVAIWNSSIDRLQILRFHLKNWCVSIVLFAISFFCCIPYFVFTVVMCFVWLYLLFLFCVLVYFCIGHC